MKKMIKLLPLIAVVFAMTGLASCKSNESKIVGKWTLVAYSDDGEWRNLEPGYNTLEFEEDGTVTKYEHFGEDFDGRHGWSIDGDVLTIGDWDPMTITKLTDKELEVKSSGEFGTECFKYKRMK